MPSQIKVVHIEPLPDWIRAIYDSTFADSDLDLVWASGLAERELRPVLRDSAVLITGKRRVTGQMMEHAGPALRLIQVVGRAPWAVDLDAAREMSVPVSCLPHRGAIAVAEHTLALLLGVMRRLVPGHLGTVQAEYRQLGIEPIRTSERVIAFNWLEFADVDQLHGKTLGIVGLGDIGLEVARRAQAFDMKVLYTKRHPLPAEHDVLARVRYTSLKELLELADVLSIHAPQTADTAGMINEAAFSLMKESAVLINTARGGLVDEDAMVDALSSGRIAGAGLDCFVEEPLPAEHPLLALDNVLLSPHLGGGTGGGQKGAVADVKANIERVLTGEPPRYPVTA